MTLKKRKTSVFDAIQELESEDQRHQSRRRRTQQSTIPKAKAAQSQSQIFHHLLECRILMQRAVVQESVPQNVKASCDDLLSKLLTVRSQLMMEEDDHETDYDDLINDNERLQHLLQDEYEQRREQWKSVLNHRHKDLKLHAGVTAKSQFKVVDSSFWQQVESTVEYESLLNKNKSDENDDKASFDDSKVYQQLLKDFVASSTKNLDAQGRLESIKKKQKKKQVDRRASKGRKIRYKEIPKLVNFTFPLSRPTTTNLDQDGWFQSLFGGAGKLN